MKTVYLIGDVGYEITAKGFSEKVNFKSTEKLRIIIDSPGGFVEPAIQIYNMIKSYRGEVEIVIGSMAASAASYIAMAVPTENRKAFENSSFMMHEATSCACGRAEDFKTMHERLLGVNKILADGYAEGIGIDRQKALEMMKTDFYMTGWESMTEGNVISDILDPANVQPPSPEDFPKDLFDLFFGKLNIAPDAHIVKEKMYAAEKRAMDDIEASRRDMEKAAAYLKDLKPDIVPEEDNNNKMEEVNMNLQEFLKSNPDAKAEYENSLQTAEAKGRESAEAQKENATDERKRIAGIIELAGLDVSETVAAAIDKGLGVDEYAKAELRAQREKRANPEKEIFGRLVPKQTPAEQDVSGAAAAKADSEEFDKKLEAARANKKNGRIV